MDRRWIGRVSAVLVAAAVAAGTVVGDTTPAAAHGACRSTTERVSQLSASTKIACGLAQRVAAAYDRVVMAGGAFPGENRIAVPGMACATTSVGDESEETSSVKCVGRRGVVRFTWGV